MPFYRITVTITSGHVHKGIRESADPMDMAYLQFMIKANKAYDAPNITSFECVQISKHCQEYRDYQESLIKPVMMDMQHVDNLPVTWAKRTKGPTKYKSNSNMPGTDWGAEKRKEKGLE